MSNQQSTVVALHELRLSVSPSGIVVQQFKYPAGFTGTGYVRRSMTDELEAQGYNFGMGNRVPTDEIMKVHGSSDETDYIGRDIYFLDGQETEAAKKLWDAMEEVLLRMKNQMDATYDAWINKKERPRKKGKTLDLHGSYSISGQIAEPAAKAIAQQLEQLGHKIAIGPMT